jgi:acetate kinase
LWIMSVLVLNCGSSSLKFALVDPISRATLLSGLAERLFEAEASLTVRDADKTVTKLDSQGHEAALQGIFRALETRGIVNISSVGHRVVHGGERFKMAVRITPEVLEGIAACVPLAPLHNPANLLGIHGAMKALPNLEHVAVFDTAFHQTMPERAYRYAIPNQLYLEHGVRRYGFHGTSHQFVTTQAAKILGVPLERSAFVSAHLGNGCSLAAVLNGRSVDTSMGLTPLEGVVMGTRSGDVDPGLHGFLGAGLGWNLEKITSVLNRESGLLGLSGLSNDCRELQEAAQNGHEGAQLALEVFCYRLAKGIAAMSVALGKLDALIFTGGIGENSVFVRAKTLELLGVLGLHLDAPRNALAVGGKSGKISEDGRTVALVVPTNEELMIALETQEVLG